MKKKIIITISVILVITIGIVIFLLFNKKEKYTPEVRNAKEILIEGNNECIKINSEEDVDLVLNNSVIECNNGPGILIEKVKSINIKVIGDNTIKSIPNEEYKGTIYSNESINIIGSGKLTIESDMVGIHSNKDVNIETVNLIVKSFDNSISSKNDVVIKSGNYLIESGDGYKTSNKENKDGKGIKASNKITITGGSIDINSKNDGIHSNNGIDILNSNIKIYSGDDAIHSDLDININSSDINILDCKEGIEGKNVVISKSNIDVNAYDDGLNAVNKENPKDSKVEINECTVKVISMGDCIDSNGDLIIDNSEVYLESGNTNVESSLDYDGVFKLNNSNFIALNANRYDENNELKSNQPYLKYLLNRTYYGPVEFGDFKYEPVINYYSHILISRRNFKLNEKYELKIKDKVFEVIFDSYNRKEMEE